MLQACETLLPYLTPSASVLDIGSGSGYLTHVLAELVAPHGKVVGVEHVSQLVDLARGNMAKSEEGKGLLAAERVKFVKGDGRKGWGEDGECSWLRGGWAQREGVTNGEMGLAPYDAIHVGAAARMVHEELLRQLKSPGR